MKCDKLLKDILEHIGTALLNLESVAHFLELAIEFKIESLLEDTSKLIVTRFMHVAEANPKFIYLLPHKVMVEILEDDDLNVHEEYDLVHWVKEYVKYHEEHAVKVPQEPELVAGPSIWSSLSDAEKKARNDAYTKEKKSITDATEKQKKEDIANFHKIGTEGFDLEELKHQAEKNLTDK